MDPMSSNLAKFLAPLVILLVAAFAILSSMTVIVESGHVGVVRTLGAVQPEALPEGFHFKKPFIDQVEQMVVKRGSCVCYPLAKVHHDQVMIGHHNDSLTFITLRRHATSD